MSAHEHADVNWSDLADQLGAAAHDHAGWYADTAAALVRPTDRLAIDLGCGGGGMTVALASALPDGAVAIGVDGNDDVLAIAREHVGAAAISSGRVRMLRLDLDSTASALDQVGGHPDLIWASGVVHHLPDQQTAVNALAERLTPGGLLALAEGGLSARHLPWDLGVGEPGLELRLIAADDRWFAAMRAGLDGSIPMPYGWTDALTKAGLGAVTTISTTIERPAPLTESLLARAISGIRRRVEYAAEARTLGADDLAAWHELLDPAAPSWLGHRRDVFALDTRSVHLGVRSAP